MDLNHSSCCSSILEKVKQHIPTIDFDSSSSENEEIVTIFQRPGLSQKVPEDFDMFSMDDDELEELLKPVAQTCWSEETMKLDDDEIVEGTTATRWGTKHSKEAEDTASCERVIVELNRAKMDVSVKPTESDMGLTVLSFASLDLWDLDDVLQNLKDDGLPLQCVSVEPSKTRADGDKERSQGNIMERLVTFCQSQSSQYLPETVETPNHIRQNNVCNKSFERMEAELQLSHQECPTVYIDLRCPDPSIKPLKTSPNQTSESKSLAKLNTHQETPPEKNSNLKVPADSQMGDREVTGKSMLLQKIREMKRKGNKYPNKYTDPPYSVSGNKAEEVKEKLNQLVESTCSHESHHLWEDKQSSLVQFEHRNLKMESPSTTQQSTIKESKHLSDQQQVKQTMNNHQHEQHQQIFKQLQIHRPHKSVNQKQPAAERTGVLYDFEASHLKSISTLPANIESKGCMLLTVNLSSPGMVEARAHGRKKHLDPAATKSDTYNTLVAWFLSLVGPDSGHNEDEVCAQVPFWVAGLQQLWTEGGLALHVLAVARQSYTPRKRDVDIHAPFYNHVCRFLSETSLTRIAHWLPQLRSLLDQHAYASPIHLPYSCLNVFISTTSNKKIIDRTFCLSPGFYWQTVETQERVCKGRETTRELHTEVSVTLGCQALLLHPLKTHYTLQLILDSGLDVCGLRLLYPPQGFLSDSAGAVPVMQRTDETCQPVLALAVRGLQAHAVLKDLISSLDPLLPGKTDPTSLNPLHCRGQEPPLFHSPRLASQVHWELCLWFSGRLPGENSQNDNRDTPSDDKVGDRLLNLSRLPSFLCATTKADLLLVVSPAVPPCCYSHVLAVCEHRGFSLRGLRRLQLQSNKAAVIGLSNQQTLVFCSPHSVTQDQGPLELPSHCLLLLLRRENAEHHSVSLPAALMREFKAQKLLGHIHSRHDGVNTVEPSFCFHTVPYSKNLFRIFVKCMWAVPDPSRVILSHKKCAFNSDMEQVAILTLCGKHMSQGLNLLHRVLTEGPHDIQGDVRHAGFKLLGLKWLPALTRLQAQELSPYEVGEPLCKDSLENLTSSPALVCALRRVDVFSSLRKLLPRDYPGNLSVLMSPTPEVAFRQASLFFFEHEMIPDHSVLPVLKFSPQNCDIKGPQMLLTVCLFKPGIWNHSLAKIGQKLQLSGLTLVGLHVVSLDKSSATSLLPAQSDPSDLEAHMEYLCSGSSLALCLQGQNAVRRLLDVLSQDDSSLWTYYASGSYQKAIQDVKRLFPEGLCCTETSTMRQEQILSMHSDLLASVERKQSCTLAPVDQDGRSPSMVSGTNREMHSANWQTTCLLIPLNASPLSQVPSQLDMLEQLLRSDCHLVAGRMSILDHEQRKHIADTLKMSLRGHERMAHLHTTAPCLIMALQGKTIVTCFNLILQSIYKKRSDLEKVGETIIYPENQEEAKQLIRYLFDALSPGSCQTVTVP